jgi:hypothetical protein
MPVTHAFLAPPSKVCIHEVKFLFGNRANLIPETFNSVFSEQTLKGSLWGMFKPSTNFIQLLFSKHSAV